MSRMTTAILVVGLIASAISLWTGPPPGYGAWPAELQAENARRTIEGCWTMLTHLRALGIVIAAAAVAGALDRATRRGDGRHAR